MDRVDAIIMGRITYETVLNVGPGGIIQYPE